MASSQRISVKLEKLKRNAAKVSTTVDPDCFVVDAPEQLDRRTSSAVDAPDSPFILADDVVVTASSDPSADFPHARHNCRIAGMNFIPVQYMPRVHQKAPEACVRLNKKHCPNCFCYVCDVEASKCKEWELHCCADDQPRGYPVSLPAFAVP
jgi:hypothetical protein